MPQTPHDDNKSGSSSSPSSYENFIAGGVTTIDASETIRSEIDPSSRPSVHTTSFHEQSSFHATTSEFAQRNNHNNNANTDDATVSADQERQVLLLMLLAQVCALHDPTPKTFTIHVVELFERGILDRESIHFLFELGLVPSISPTMTSRLLTAVGNTETTTTVINNNVAEGDSSANGASESIETVQSSNSEDSVTTAACEEIAMALTTTNTATTSKLAAVFAASGDPHRSAEAYAIRATLAQYEQLQQNLSSVEDEEGDARKQQDQHVRPWDAKHFPLSLSRYQREFIQVALLASGSFGQVFHATRKMDGCDYAIKKVDFDATGYSNDTIQEVVREVECLAKVSDHPNVVTYYTSWLEPSWMTGGQTMESSTAASNNQHSPSGSPTNAKRRGQQQQRRLLLTNQLQDSMHSGSLSDDDGIKGRYASSRNYESSGFYEESTRDASSDGGMWQRYRRFSFESSVDSSFHSWTSYQEQSIEELGRATFEDESSSSVILMKKGRNPQEVPNHDNGRSNGRKPAYRYQISLYIQMQLCHPASLADWIRERNSKVPEDNYQERMGPALEIFEQIVKGLAHVHEKGIIHRDLKPANIFASKDGQIIKIGDFGLSKQLMGLQDKKEASSSPPRSRGDVNSSSHHEHWHNAKRGAIIPRPTQSSQAITPFRKPPSGLSDNLLTMGIGTRSYAAPEQLQSKSYSTAADIFSLGLIFLELVCCFETEHERLHNFQKCRQQQGVQQWLVDKYPEIAKIIMACTHPDPSIRPSAQAILDTIPLWQLHSTPTASITALVKAEANIMGELHNDLLRKSLELRNRELEQHREELAEKDRVIEKLRLEMERMKASNTKGSATSSLPDDSDDTLD